jgi:hypothetical protein
MKWQRYSPALTYVQRLDYFYSWLASGTRLIIIIVHRKFGVALGRIRAATHQL